MQNNTNSEIVVGKSNCETIGYNYNKMEIIHAALEGKKIVLIDDGNEYKELSEAIFDEK